MPMVFAGIDDTAVYTTRDAGKRGLVGDSLLRRQVSDPRDELEFCSPLALQAKGKKASSFIFAS